MKTKDEKKRIVCITKILFLTEGILLLVAGINDMTSYRSLSSDDLQFTRVINITWLMIGFACLHLTSAIFAFFYSCTTTVYQPFICFILWTLCISTLVFHHMQQVWNIENVVSTQMAISLALVTTYCILVVAQTLYHVRLICLQKQDNVENVTRNEDDYVIIMLPEKGFF